MGQHGPAWASMGQHGPAWASMGQHGPAWLCSFVELHAVLCVRRGTECCTRRRCGLSLQQRMNPGMESSKLGRKGKQDRHGEEMHVCSKDVPKCIKMRQNASTCIKMYQTSTKISQRRDIDIERDSRRSSSKSLSAAHVAKMCSGSG